MEKPATGNADTTRAKSFYSVLGPGILYAAAAVGVSHLVQATRAGADYGLGLALVILIACFFKYPSLRFGGDYAAATGKNLITNYRSQGWWAFGIYAVAQLFTMVFVIAAIALFALGLVQAALGLQINPVIGVALLLAGTVIMLLKGKYHLLESVGKIIVAIFSILILAAVFLVIGKMDWDLSLFHLPEINAGLLLYVVALVGFMPTPTDGSVIQSLWTCARAQDRGVRPHPADVRLDFNVGYLTSILLALCFLVLGTGVMHSSGIKLEASGVGFSRQLIELFTATIGARSFPLIAIAAIFVMVSTLITVVDGMTRIVVAIAGEAIPAWRESYKPSTLYGVFLVILSLLAVLVISILLTSFTVFLDITSVIVFVVSPLLALLNHRAMWSESVPEELRPGTLTRYWSLSAIVFLFLVTLAYFYFRFL